MENTTKKYGKALCFTPLASYTLWFVYYLMVNKNVIVPNHMGDHLQMMANTLAHYPALFTGLALCSIWTTTVLVYLIIHIARLKEMDTQTKIGWIVFMGFLAPFAFIVLWYTELKKEPDNIKVYHSIT